MRVTPEQSEKVQEICFNNGIQWAVACFNKSNLDKPYIYIYNKDICYGIKKSFFMSHLNEEIDADLFIRTNGTCEENTFNELFEKVSERVNDFQIGNRIEPIDKYRELEQKLKKKNEILKKARIKRKNQREELHKLNLKLQKSINLASHRKVVDWHIERNKALLAEIESLKQSSKISYNMLHQQQKSHEIVLIEVDAIQKLHKKEIEKLQAIIEYLEKKIK